MNFVKLVKLDYRKGDFMDNRNGNMGIGTLTILKIMGRENYGKDSLGHLFAVLLRFLLLEFYL